MNPQQYATYGAHQQPPAQQQQFYGRTGSAAFGAAQFGTVGRTGSMSGGAMTVPLHAWSPPSPQEHQYYDMLFAMADEEKRNAIGGRIAVAFFSRSGVDKLHLREIWTIADSQQRSELSRNEFYVAMRLISMAQRGEQVSAQRFHELASTLFPLPTFEGIAPPQMMAPPMMQPQSQQGPPPAAPTGQPSGGYAITDEEKQRYDGIFQQYDSDHDGFLHGGEAVQLFGMSGLDRGVLREIWALADRGQDSRLDVKEFYIAMHLIVCVSKRGLPLPKELPTELAESVFPTRSSFTSSSTDPLASLASGAGAPGSRTSSTSMSHMGVAPTPPAPVMAPVSVQQDTTPPADPMDAFAGLSASVETAQPSRTSSFGRTNSGSSQPSTSAPPPASRLSATGSSLDAAMSSMSLGAQPTPTPPASSTGSFGGSAMGMGGMGMGGMSMGMSSMPEPARERAGSASSMSSFASVSTDVSAAYGSASMAHPASAAPPAPTPGFAPVGSLPYAAPPPQAYGGAPPMAAKPFLSDEAEAAAVAQLDRSNDELVQALRGVEKKQHAVELLSEKLRELDQLRHELVALSMKRDTLQAASSAAAVAAVPPPRDNGADVQAVRAVEQTLRQLVEGEQAAIQKLQADIAHYERELQHADTGSSASLGGAFGALASPSAQLPAALSTADSTPKNDFETFGGFGSSSPGPDSAAFAAVESGDAFAHFNFN